MSIALLALSILWLALIAYAVLGGADFGAGIWDLFALGTQRQRHRQLINQAIGPVWEANHVWLIFLIVGLFSVFPAAFTALTVALFIPLTIALVGIVLRGAAFIFRTYELDTRNRTTEIWSRVFSSTSVITPFFLGTSAAAVASGQLTVSATGVTQANLGSAWLSPFALTIGAMAVAICATLAAVYLTVEASRANDLEMARAYRMRALSAGTLAGALDLLGLLLSPAEAPMLWNGMLQHAWPVALVTIVIALLTAWLLYTRRYRFARIMIVLETAFLIGSWGLSQYPYIVPPHVTIDNSANDPNVITALVIAMLVGMVVLLPSLYYLFSVFKLAAPVSGVLNHQNNEG